MPLHEALVLYRSIRRLHRRLPAALKFMGDQYLKDEFVRHKAAQQEYIPGFIKGWTAYRDTLADQISRAEEAAALADADAAVDATAVSGSASSAQSAAAAAAAAAATAAAQSPSSGAAQARDASLLFQLGSKLDSNHLESMNAEQLGQLYALKQATTNPAAGDAGSANGTASGSAAASGSSGPTHGKR